MIGHSRINGNKFVKSALTWLMISRYIFSRFITLPKTNMDTQNDGLEKVTPFRNGNFGIYVSFLGCSCNEKLPPDSGAMGRDTLSR